MERKGVYNKGKQGHARNVNSYFLAMQRFKKWRLPLTVLLALMFIFGISPVVGEEFQASLVTLEEQAGIANQDPKHMRKALLDEIQSFVHDCEKWKLPSCVNAGKTLITSIANPEHDVSQLIPEAVKFEDSFASEVGGKACRYELGNILQEIQSVRKKLSVFTATYGDFLDSALLRDRIDAFDKTADQLALFVKSCRGM